MQQTPVPISTGMVTALMSLLRLIVRQRAHHLFPTGNKGRAELYDAYNWVVQEFAKGWSNSSDKERENFYNKYRINSI